MNIQGQVNRIISIAGLISKNQPTVGEDVPSTGVDPRYVRSMAKGMGLSRGQTAAALRAEQARVQSERIKSVYSSEEYKKSKEKIGQMRERIQQMPGRRGDVIQL